MTKFITESVAPVPKKSALSVPSRVLISLLLLGSAALMFRASLKPSSDSLTPQTFQEPLQGAGSAQISLEGTRADLELDVRALAGLALTGQTLFPQKDALSRSARLEGKTLSIRLAEILRHTGFSFGLNWNNTSPRWSVQLNRELPTDLKVGLGSGDVRLNLEGARLKSLDARVGSGELNITLPSSIGGQVRAFTGSGDLRVDASPRTLSKSEFSSQNATFVSQTGSGEQRLDLSSTGFQSVEAQSGSGDLSVTLPARFESRRSSVPNPLQTEAPRLKTGTALLKTGSGELSLRVPQTLKTGTLHLHSGSGNVTVQVSPGAAVRATLSGNLDGARVPEGYALIGGVYWSPSARQGGPALDLAIDSGSGDIALVTEESR